MSHLLILLKVYTWIEYITLNTLESAFHMLFEISIFVIHAPKQAKAEVFLGETCQNVTQIKETVYKGLIPPILEYACTVWESYHTGLQDELEKVQNQAARFVTSDYFFEHGDIKGTERVFKKVVHLGQNAMRFVDKNGMPMRIANTSLFSHLHGTYVFSPRGVPIRKSSHCYSGQQTHAKLHNLANSLDSNITSSSTSIQSYSNGMASADSSNHEIDTAHNSLMRAATSVPGTSVAKRGLTQRSATFLNLAPAAPDVFVQDLGSEKSNDSPQGKRLEKEWSALSQCRAMKRSSEIIAHRVDRTYFMTGNKLPLQSKYHVDNGEMRQLQELQHVRATSRFTRPIQLRKGDMYRPERSSHSQKSLHTIQHHGDIGHNDMIKRCCLLQVMASPKLLMTKPRLDGKRPLRDLDDKDIIDKNSAQTNDGIQNKDVLHSADVDNDTKDPEDVQAILDNGVSETDETEELLNGKCEDIQDDGIENDAIFGNDAISEKVLENDISDDGSAEIDESVFGNELSVRRSEVKSEISDTDKTYVKSEDYLGK